MSNTCKHLQRWCSDNTWVPLWIVWFLQPLITRNQYIKRIIKTRKPLCIYYIFHAIIGYSKCLPANLWLGLKWGATNRQIRCVNSEWEKFQQRSGNPYLWLGEILLAGLGLQVGKISVAELGSQLLPREKNLISRVMTSVGTWSGVQPVGRLDVSTLSNENPSSRVAIRLGRDREKLPGGPLISI